MAELENQCCTPAAQETCCEPDDKASCCGESHDSSCGCAAGAAPATTREVRETVREKYAAAARAATQGSPSGCCSPADETGVFGAALYAEKDEHEAAAAALGASLGCGVPTAVADLHEGEVVLDLGSGAGADVLISARRVGPTGRAIGIDMTDEMLELARTNAIEARIQNVEFLKGYLEQLPLPDASVDVVISNCVINLSADKPKALAEAARVLRPGGRFAVSDVIADEDMDEATRADMAAWTGCIAGALTESEFRSALAAAGLADLEFRETHRVHAYAAAAIIRARKPIEPSAACELACSLSATGLRERKGLINRLLAEATGEPSPIHGGVQARFPRSREIEQQLGALVALEADCCAFLSLTVHTVHDAVILEVTGPPGAQSVITSLFATTQI